MKVLAAIIASLLISTSVSEAADTNTPSTFAQCLKDKGAVMYSAWWCGACVRQLRQFDPDLPADALQDSEKMKRFPFMVECANAKDGKMLDHCQGKDIEGTPTWHFPDGTAHAGWVELPGLADKTGCKLP